MKNISKLLIAGLMALIMAISVPIQIFASSKPIYISEMAIESGSTADKAKAKLTDAGYTVYDYNISNCDNDDETDGYMYVGYKTTENPDEAITDIRLMHMGGGYSYAEYEQLIEQKKNDVGRMVEQLEIAVKEYRINYTNGKKAALTAYKMLNQFKEDDTGLLMGDYFLNTAKTKADYTNVLMQCNTMVLITVENALAIACSATYDQGILRVSNLDPEDFIGAVQYEEVATAIYDDLQSVQTALAIYANSGLTKADNATDDDISKAYDNLTEDKEMGWAESFAFAKLLESIELYNGDTLYDLLMTDLDELTTEDLYPLASVLSEGQAALLNVAGLKNIITADMTVDEKWTEVDAYSYKPENPISVYAGVDRSLFKGGVALTNKAMVEAAANTEKGWFGGMSKDAEEIFYTIIAVSYFTFFGACALACISRSIAVHVFTTVGAKLQATPLTLGIFGSNALDPMVEAAYARYFFTLRALKIAFTTFAYIAMVALGVLLIASAIYLIALGIEYYNPTYDEIPRILVEKNTDIGDETVYTYYYGIKNTADKVVDINQHDGNRWVSLYTTKDAQAGNPILAELKIQRSNLLSGYSGVNKFSQDTAFNLNKFSYNIGFSVDRDGQSVKIEESYMFFKRYTENTDKYASIITGASALIGVSGLAVGAILGILGTVVTMKKKKVTDN